MNDLGDTDVVVPDQLASQRLIRYLQAVAREAGYDLAALDNRSVQEFRKRAQQLSRLQATQLIELIQSEDATYKNV